MKMVYVLSIPVMLVGCVFLSPLEEDHFTTGSVSRISLRVPDGIYRVELIHEGDVVFSDSLESTENEISFDHIFERAGDYELRIVGESYNRAFEIRVDPITWLVFVWMIADNSLSDQAEEDMSEMEPSEDVAIHVVKDSKSDEYVVLSDSGILRKAIDGLNGGDPVQLREFLEDFYSIDSIHKMFIIWNHGLAWLGDSEYRTEAVGFDEDSKDALTTHELSRALRGMRFDILGFDACYMGSIEVIYQLRESTDYIIASPGPEPWRGWEYSFFSEIEGDTKPIELSKLVLDSFSKEYRDSPETPYLSGLYVYDTNLISDLASSLNRLGVDELMNVLSTPLIVYRTSGPRILVDAKSLFERSHALSSILEELVMYGTDFYDLSATIYFPDSEGVDYMEDYETLDFSSETIWKEVIEKINDPR